MNRFANKVALITGGASGMGLATARLLHAEGATVVLTGRCVEAEYGRLDVLFANAGAGIFKPPAELTEQDVDQLLGVNLKGLFFTVTKALPLLSRGSAIVLNATWTQYRGLGLASMYSATKAAVTNLTHTLGADLAARGIRINSVSPG
ncbi:SDR family NAD(P)-dependent oxidoreductase [Crossiella cryophila]|uniref:NAD(P)-dependent dehydrogenase (Short-subunit alcohol dehydrogenase family) n=1 Tax=Crossiella cryophila TaxID=43355 RepID=A0A7W7FWL2_9PSEU|nr:SDR family NAD(P)-dependent oxidoreductase [Crossiella cryophila]MBB4678039.1 NAD(P)-dependent dehydrogenase (short-subunit alcohol dehydrogenase family) [Crossiella cryophila]